MKKEYIVELTDEEADELMDEHWVGDLVRCEDCTNYGNNGCRLKRMAYQTAPDWFCADGKPKDESTSPCGPDYCELNLDGDET